MFFNPENPIVVVGLGNPGFEYDETRHNVGFMVVDELSARLHCLWKPGKGDYLLSRLKISDAHVVLVKPLTFMNNSGEAVVDVLERYPTRIENVLAVVDDLAFGVGTIRVRAKGSDGGHNGLRSLIYHLNSHEFPRIRCGIRKEIMPPKSEMSNFVLSPFDDDERDIVEKMIATAADAVVEFAVSGIAKTMNRFNL